MNINHICNITGCAAALAVGAWGQNAKADYPNPAVVEMHWRQNPKIFRETFEALFPKAERLSLWSEAFPDWFEKQNGKLYEARTGGHWLSFHTDDDLAQLSCDVELKKIIKIVGSSEFLKKVLPEAVTQSILTCAVGGEDFKTGIKLLSCSGDGFFNTFGRGKLRMQIKQSLDGCPVLTCDFEFVFENKSSLTVLKEYRASYNVSDGESAKAEFLKKKEKLPCFPWSAAMEAKEKIPLVYAKLRNVLKNDPKRYWGCKICSAVVNAKENLEAYLGIHESAKGGVSAQKEYKVRESGSILGRLYEEYGVYSLIDVFSTEDFLKGIFGEKFWNILEYGCSDNSFGNLDVSFAISPCNDGLKVSCLFRNRCRGSMTADVVTFQGESLKWKWLDFNYIKFCFFFDPKKNAISHVTFGDKLILNYESVGKGETKDTLLTTDDHCF